MSCLASVITLCKFAKEFWIIFKVLLWKMITMHDLKAEGGTWLGPFVANSLLGL